MSAYHDLYSRTPDIAGGCTAMWLRCETCLAKSRRFAVLESLGVAEGRPGFMVSSGVAGTMEERTLASVAPTTLLGQ